MPCGPGVVGRALQDSDYASSAIPCAPTAQFGLTIEPRARAADEQAATGITPAFRPRPGQAGRLRRSRDRFGGACDHEEYGTPSEPVRMHLRPQRSLSLPPGSPSRASCPHPEPGCSRRWRWLRSGSWRWRAARRLARVSAIRPHPRSEAFVLPREPQVPAPPRTRRAGSGARGAASGVRPGREGPHGVGQHAVRLAFGRAEGSRAQGHGLRTASPTATVLSTSLMGLKRGERHTAHRQQMNPHFAPKAVLQGASRLDEVSSLYLRTWRSGETRHGSLKADLHHWSANSLGSFLCGREWDQRTDLAAVSGGDRRARGGDQLPGVSSLLRALAVPGPSEPGESRISLSLRLSRGGAGAAAATACEAGAGGEGRADVLETLVSLKLSQPAARRAGATRNASRS